MFKTAAAATVIALCCAAPLHAKTVFTDLAAWLAAIPEAPDFTEDFETGFADGDIYTGTGTMTLSPGFPIETGTGSINGSNPIGTFALELTDNTGTVVTLSFAQPITYLGLFYIDAGSPVIDGTGFTGTGVSGDSALFAGFIFDAADNKTSVIISSVDGDGRWGLDDIAWGAADTAAVPVPAALPLLAGAIGLLAVARRRA